MDRLKWIESGEALAVSTQCELLSVTRSVVYDQKKRPQKAVDELELILLNKLDEEYTRHPFYGTRRMTKYLCGCGYAVNRKRVQRLMQTLGLAGMAPGPNTSKPHSQHKIYPYLLRGLDVSAPTRCGVPTSPTSGCGTGLCIWSRSLTGIAARYCRGRYRTPWIQGSVWIAWKQPSRSMVRRRSLIPTRGRSLPATVSLAY